MTKEQIIEAINPLKGGSFIRVEYEKIISTGSGKVHKITTATVRVKFLYTNMKTVVKSTGTTQLPDWKAWDSEYNYLLNYVGDNSSKKGTIYLRTGSTNCPTHKKKIKYVLDGAELTEETNATLLMTVKNLDRDNPEPIRDIDIKHILKIGK